MNQQVFMYHVLRCLWIIARNNSNGFGDMRYLLGLEHTLDKMEDEYGGM